MQIGLALKKAVRQLTKIQSVGGASAWTKKQKVLETVQIGQEPQIEQKYELGIFKSVNADGPGGAKENQPSFEKIEK